MKRKLLLAAIALVASAAVAVPLTAFAGDAHRLVIGVRYEVHPGTPLTGTGTWAACCAINDSGTTSAVVNVTGTTGDYAMIEGTHTFESALGSFTDHYRGTLGPLSSPRQIAAGHWEIVAGTGAYASARGDGSFTVVVDGTTGLATGVHEGHVTFSG